ncbi:MAG: YggT family protein [Deltaproteobacteria bacterium]|nr:YggT family protein [Deltaproteobacteria bacterium]
MFVVSNLLNALAVIIHYGLTAYMWIIIIRALISWVNPDPYNPVVRFLYQATEPLLWRIRRFLPYMGGFDLSPIVVLMMIVFLKLFLVDTLTDMAIKFR